MRNFVAAFLIATIVSVAGCQRSSDGPTSRTPHSAAPPAMVPVRQPQPTGKAPWEMERDRAAAYTRANPWGDNTGTARLIASVMWPPEGGQEAQPLPRYALTLTGVRGTASEGLYYRVRANEEGEFVFDRIKGETYRLSDQIVDDQHWRLRVEIQEGEELRLDCGAGNSVKVRDDFPPNTK